MAYCGVDKQEDCRDQGAVDKQDCGNEGDAVDKQDLGKVGLPILPLYGSWVFFPHMKDRVPSVVPRDEGNIMSLLTKRLYTRLVNDHNEVEVLQSTSHLCVGISMCK